jgi:hypothetical protein
LADIDRIVEIGENMTIQTTSGAVETGSGDKIHIINGVQFVVKVRQIAGDYYLILGTNHGSGWDEGVFVSDILPATGDAKAFLAAALPAINKVIAGTSAGSTDLSHQVDGLIQTLHVVDNKLTF